MVKDFIKKNSMNLCQCLTLLHIFFFSIEDIGMYTEYTFIKQIYLIQQTIYFMVCNMFEYESIMISMGI